MNVPFSGFRTGTSIFSLVSLFFLALLLTACGGSVSGEVNDDDGGGGDSNGPPVINSLGVTPNPTNTSTAVSINWGVSDADGDILTCLIDADGDGSNDYTVNDCAKNRSQTHTFTTAGTYTARLTVKDGNGGSVQKTVSITINGTAVNHAPVIDSLGATPNQTTTSTAVSIGWVVSDADGDTLTCLIDVDGDGSNDYTVNDCANNRSQTHTFTTAGTYTARLIVTDGNGESSQQALSITVITPQVSIAAPTNVRAVAGNGQVTLSWDGVPAATAYNVYLATETGVTPDTYSVLAGGMAVLDVSSPFTQTGLSNGQSYYFVITAVKDGAESPASQEIQASPAAPVDISALIDDSQLAKVTQAAIDDFDLYQSAQLTLEAPAIAENGAVVPVTLSFETLTPGPGAFWLLVPGNPETVAARFLIEPNVIPYISTRIKMAGSSDVTAVYLADNGATIYTAKRYIQVTIVGFGN